MVRPEIKKRRQELAAKAIQSRKARKKLEKVVLRKKSKVDRNTLLTEIKKYQLPSDQLDCLHSTSFMQTQGLKRFLNEDNFERKVNDIERAEQCLDAASLLKRKRRRNKPLVKEESSSSSEDTDDISTDTEIYDDWQPKHEEVNEVEEEEVLKTSEIIPLPKNVDAKHPPHSLTNGQVAEDKKSKQSQPAVFVLVKRLPEVEKSRLELPIIGEEQYIMETIRYNDITIISGETGSGKTTQLPQFLFEAGYALNGKIIGITEPRRVAAISMSERVAHELNVTTKEVSYQIRFSGNVSDTTKIKFMTDGVLLRECQHDFLLSKYSVIIVDEAHERSVYSDILIGLLSRIVPMRAKHGDSLKLVIMSATMRLDDFTKNTFLFKSTPPTISIEARQYPVYAHPARQTPTNYLQAAYNKVRSIHTKMPKGGILVFVTSQMEVKILCKKLQMKYPKDLHCLGLYAMLPIDKQRLVFKEPPERTRLCVIATNVAETSITIPNIKYVVDTGMEKKKVYDLVTGASRFVTTWTSKSSAEQRMGRAGRMGPGHCYRLYHSSVFQHDFPDFAEPRILQKPVEDVLLQMKSMNIDNVVNFPFPTRPSLEALKAAEKKLILLGALDDSKLKKARFEDIAKTEFSSRPTPLGKAMAQFAVGARCSKIIVQSPAELLRQAIALVSSITVREMFLEGNKWRDLRKKWCGHGTSKQLGDFMIMLRAIIKSDSFGCLDNKCIQYGLRTKAMLEISKLRRQLLNEANKHLNLSKKLKSEKLKGKPNDEQIKILRQLLLSSYCDHVARRLPDGDLVKRDPNDPTKVQKTKLKHAYECMESEQPVYISNESILKGEHPEFIIYKELYQGEKKTYMRDIAVTEPTWFPHYAYKLCTFTESDDKTAPVYNKLLDQVICTRNTTYGALNWSLGPMDVPMQLVDSGVDIYKYFASFLLAGEVFDWFKKYVAKLLSPPSIMTKPWSKLQPRTSKVLQALISYNLKSRKDLVEVWKRDNQFLKREYLAWLPESIHPKVSQEWGQLVSQ